MTWDRGYAPHVSVTLASLANCMVRIRRHAKVNDIVVGLAGKNLYEKGNRKYFTGKTNVKRTTHEAPLLSQSLVWPCVKTVSRDENRTITCFPTADPTTVIWCGRVSKIVSRDEYRTITCFPTADPTTRVRNERAKSVTRVTTTRRALQIRRL